MSDAYEQEMAEERAITDQIAAAEAREAPPVNAGGRPYKADPIKVIAWRQAHKASIADTAKRFSVSEASVKRWTRDYTKAAKLARLQWECDQLEKEARLHDHDMWLMFNGQVARARSFARIFEGHQLAAAKGTDRESAAQVAYEAALDAAEQEVVEGWTRMFGVIPGYVPPF